jgi:hypothetical protein
LPGFKALKEANGAKIGHEERGKAALGIALPLIAATY